MSNLLTIIGIAVLTISAPYIVLLAWFTATKKR